MTHGSLFSGIGGFDLAAENAGWTNVFHCERDKFCQRVLSYHFPNSTPHDDVTTFDGLPYQGQIDVLSGGFPCQPFSHAGERRGAEDDRHLWPEMFRIIQEVRPRWVVGENVRGLTDWNEGMVFDEVLTNLETEGYEVTSFVLPACGQNLPHRRDRIWIVAHRDTHGEGGGTEQKVHGGQDTHTKRDSEGNGGVATHPNGDRLERSIPTDLHRQQSREEGTAKERVPPHRRRIRPEEFPTQSPICGGDDGLPTELDGITFPKWRKESVKAYGNAVAVPVVEQIFETINDYEKRYGN